MPTLTRATLAPARISRRSCWRTGARLQIDHAQDLRARAASSDDHTLGVANDPLFARGFCRLGRTRLVGWFSLVVRTGGHGRAPSIRDRPSSRKAENATIGALRRSADERKTMVRPKCPTSRMSCSNCFQLWQGRVTAWVLVERAQPCLPNARARTAAARTRPAGAGRIASDWSRLRRRNGGSARCRRPGDSRRPCPCG
jgi:hypothetical protein